MFDFGEYLQQIAESMMDYGQLSELEVDECPIDLSESVMCKNSSSCGTKNFSDNSLVGASDEGDVCKLSAKSQPIKPIKSILKSKPSANKNRVSIPEECSHFVSYPNNGFK
jgi:hypothetical protein